MNDWLSEIEEFIPKIINYPYITDARPDMRRLARVIRELANVIRNIELDENTAIVYSPEGLIKSLVLLSSDAKELLK